ncbi:hypothetical protein D049_3476B, partial [Vibrio parahaemolyticus VPTS-2010]
AQANHQ